MKPSIDPWEPRPAEDSSDHSDGSDGRSGDVLIYGGPWPKRQVVARVYAACPETGGEMPIAANANVVEAAPRLLEDLQDALWWLIKLRDAGVTDDLVFTAEAREKFAGIIRQLTFGVNLGRFGRDGEEQHGETADDIFARVTAEAREAERRCIERASKEEQN